IDFITNAHFTNNGGANISDFLVTNLVDHHLYDWWIDGTNTLQGIELGPYWSNIGLVAPGQFTASGGTNLLLNNTVAHHLYDWWITSQGQLNGIDLGLYWVNVELTGTGHFNNSSANDELLVRNTADGHFYEWWIANNQLQGVDLGLSVSTGVSGSSGMMS